MVFCDYHMQTFPNDFILWWHSFDWLFVHSQFSKIQNFASIWIELAGVPKDKGLLFKLSSSYLLLLLLVPWHFRKLFSNVIYVLRIYSLNVCWTVDLIGWQFLKWHTLITFRSTLALVLPLLLGLLLLLAVQGGDLERLLLAHLLRLEVAELEVLRLLLDDGLLLANLEKSKKWKNKVNGLFLVNLEFRSCYSYFFQF